MSMRPISLALLLAGLPAVLAACDDKKEPGTADETGETDDTDTSTDTDTDGAVDAAVVLVADALLDVQPPTLAEETGGSVTATVAASASRADGSALSLDDAIAGVALVAVFADGSEAEVAAESVGEDQLALSFDVPAGLAPATGARTPVEILADGQPLVEAAVGLHVDPAALLESLVGDRTGIVEHGGALSFDICHAAVVDEDEDGTVELLAFGVEGDAFVAMGCTSDGSGWSCAETTEPAVARSGDGLYCGTTDHFLVDGDSGGIGISGVAYTDAGYVVTSGQWTWQGGAWTGTGSPGVVEGLPLFAVVLGLNNTKKDPEAPVTSLLTVTESSGTWTGSYHQGREPGSWTSLGTVTPEGIGKGYAWAGLFTESDLSDAPGTPETWAWGLDGSKQPEGGELILEVGQYSASTKAFSRARQVTLKPPGFTVEGAAAVGEDLDGDGYPELILEAWGEGSWAAWLVPAATDKAATQSPRRLGADQAHTPMPVLLRDGASLAVPQSTFSMRGGTLHSVQSSPLHMDSSEHSSPLYEGVVASTGWDAASAMASELSELAPDTGGVIARQRLSSGTCSSGRGLCQHGKCFCASGYSGASRLLAGGGDGSDVASAAPGELLWVAEDPGGDALLFNTGAKDQAADISALLEAPDVSGISQGFHAGGSAVTIDGADWVAAAWGAEVSAIPDGDGGFAIVVFEGRHVGDSADTMVVQVNIRVRYQDTEAQGVLPPDAATNGATTPVLLDRAVGSDEGVMLGWRDGSGQAWVGVLDLGALDGHEDGKELPFLTAPVAVGEPISTKDAEAMGLWGANAGMLAVPRRIIADTPFLSMEDLEERFSGWDDPMDAPFTDHVGEHGPAVMLVGADEDGLVRTIYLPAQDAIDELRVLDAGDASSPDSAPVPRVAASVMPDTPPVVVSVDAAGSTSLHAFDGSGSQASQWDVYTWGASWTPRDRVTAADFNGDGLADLHSGRGGRGEVVLMGGTGDVLGRTVPARSLTNIDSAHERGAFGQECAIDASGGGGWTSARPICVSWGD